MKNLFLSFFIFIYSTICCAQNSILGPSGLPEKPGASQKEVVWFRQSAERIAMDRELFFMAENTIKQNVQSKKLKQWGVIIDIDETLLDNSAWNEAHSIHHVSQTWNEYAATAQSKAIPGAVEFTHYIHDLGGYVNLVSNRPMTLLSKTKQNLKNQHIYFDQVLLDASNAGTSFVDKNPRFEAIINGRSPSTLPPQTIVAWLGDNIQDFPKLDQGYLKKRNPPGDDFFGKIYFIFPNPMYGSWEK